MMRKEFVLVVGAALSVGVVQAIASETVGEIKRVDGAAMISKGEHFVAAQQGMKLNELDRLIVLEQSEALLEFADGCRHLMKEKELLTVGSTSVCVDSPVKVTDVASAQLSAPVGGLGGVTVGGGAVGGGAVGGGAVGGGLGGGFLGGLGALGGVTGAGAFAVVAGAGVVAAGVAGSNSNAPPPRPLDPISPL